MPKENNFTEKVGMHSSAHLWSQPAGTLRQEDGEFEANRDMQKDARENKEAKEGAQWRR